MRCSLPIYFASAVWVFLSGCTPKTAQENDEPKEYVYYADWMINMEYLEAGCSGGYDCIQSIDEPTFVSVNEVSYLQDDDLVVGFRMGNELRCYPHAILNWHEMVNDEVGNTSFTINFCPLTGSAMAWDRMVNGKRTEFGVSGLLFNSNVIAYDRETGSHWSQMKQRCINGEFYKQQVTSYPVLETNWATWKTMYPKSKVLSTETGFSRDYTSYPYGSYVYNDDVYFPTEFDNDSIHPKIRMFGVIGDADTAHVFPYQLFETGLQIKGDTVFGKPVWVVGSEPDNFMLAIAGEWMGQPFQPELVTHNMPAILKDQQGNLFDAFGYCIDGPQKGKSLEVLNGFSAYWFAWAAFYPNMVLHH